MDTLLVAIMLWLSANFELPISHDQPHIEFASASEITAIRYKSFTSKQRLDEVAPASVAPGDVVAIYDDDRRTIYLPAGWRGDTPAELSVLVHEMVHHLQNMARLKFECPQEREGVAYAAQERWLGLFGRDLSRDFGLDAMTIFFKSRCFY